MKLIFGADISLGGLENPTKEIASFCTSDVSGIFQDSDFSMINLENVFGKKEDYNKILKSGPNLISSVETSAYVEALSPSLIGMANNHCGDYGEEALLNTITYLNSKGYPVIGAGKNISEAYRPYRFEKDGQRISILAVCENEFGIAKENKAGGAGYDLWRVARALEAERADGFLPIMFFHGGNEENPFPSPGKVTLYRHFIEMGAGAVIAMHTHCPQGYEIYQKCPIIYSMGNLFFPKQFQDHDSWFYGYLSSLELENGFFSFTPIPYRFDSRKIDVLQGEKKESFLRYLDALSSPIADMKEIMRLFEGWCMMDGLCYASNAVYSIDMLSSQEKAVHMKNVFGCEAHNELVTSVLRLCYEGRIEEAKAVVPEIKRMQQIPV